MSNDRIHGLKARRIANARKKARDRKREKNGDKIIRAITEVLGEECQLSSSTQLDVAGSVRIAARIEDSPGLVLAYTGGSAARQILGCIEDLLGGEVDALMWFDEKAYMGAYSCRNLSLRKLGDLAVALEDRVYVSVLRLSGVVAVDYYRQGSVPDRDFSVVVQGADLELRVKHCFRN